MLRIIILISAFWFILDKLTGDGKDDNVKQLIKEKMKVVKKAENELEEITSMIEDTKAEIIKSSRRENLEDIEFYTELLELLLKERENLIDKTTHVNKTIKTSKKIGKKIKGVIKGIKEGLKE